MHKLCAMPTLHPTRVAAERLGVSVWTVTRFAKEDPSCYTAKVPGQTGAYLFTDDDIARLAISLGREVAA